MMATSGGRGANRSGKRLERAIAEILEDKGYLFVPPVRFFPSLVLNQRVFTCQREVGKNIYAKIRKVDLLLYHPKLWRDCLAIQCKWQASGGTTDEKFPFEVLSIAENKLNTIIILDGGGYSAGAKQWLLNQAGKKRLLAVHDQGSFTRFAKTHL